MVVQYLNKDTYITREKLSQILGVCDRTVRHMVEEARNEGHLIVSSDATSERGYKIASTGHEIKTLRRLYESRIAKQMKTYANMFSPYETKVFVDKAIDKIKEEQLNKLNQVLKDKQCTSCDQCKEFNGVCVYDI